MRYRWIYIGLGALAVAVIAMGALLARSGDPAALPDAIESVFPRPNDSVIRQTVVEVDLRVGYAADIYVDGFLVPSTEVSIVDGTNVYRWSPSPTSVYLAEWSPGTHTVRVVWRSIVGSPEAGEFSWEFRVQ